MLLGLFRLGFELRLKRSTKKCECCTYLTPRLHAHKHTPILPNWVIENQPHIGEVIRVGRGTAVGCSVYAYEDGVRVAGYCVEDGVVYRVVEAGV